MKHINMIVAWMAISMTVSCAAIFAQHLNYNDAMILSAGLAGICTAGLYGLSMLK